MVNMKAFSGPEKENETKRTPWVFISLPTNCKYPATWVQYKKNTVGKEKQKKLEEKFPKVEILPSAYSRTSESDF